MLYVGKMYMVIFCENFVRFFFVRVELLSVSALTYREPIRYPSSGLRAQILKLLRSPGIDSKESIPPAFVSLRAGTTALFLVVPRPHRLFLRAGTTILFLLGSQPP